MYFACILLFQKSRLETSYLQITNEPFPVIVGMIVCLKSHHLLRDATEFMILYGDIVSSSLFRLSFNLLESYSVKMNDAESKLL